MRTVLFTFALLPLLASAQIPNGGFENWVDQGGYLEPVGWRTYNDAVPGGAIQMVEQGSPGVVGTYHAVITSRDVPGGSPIQGWTSTGFQYTSRPAMLTGQWQYGVQPNDTAQVQVALINGGTQTLIARGVLEVTGILGSWQLFQVPLTYLSTETPDTAFIQIVSSISFPDPIAGSFVKVDDLAFAGTVGMQEEPDGAIIGVIPNPGTDHITVSLSPGDHTITLFDAIGRVVLEQRTAEERPVISTDDLPAGLYRITVRDERGAVLGATWVKER